MTHRVFVYGTLKSGFWNHYLLEGSEFFRGAATVPTYKMIENGFPVIMPDPEGKPLEQTCRSDAVMSAYDPDSDMPLAPPAAFARHPQR